MDKGDLDASVPIGELVNQTQNPLRVLVVDDDEVMRKLLREVLAREGYVVELASSGEEAVRALSAQKYPIVLSDIRMLEMDGMAVLREVKKSGTRSAVILMTGFGSMEGAIEAIQEGAFDYVSKPFKLDDLKLVVSRAAKHWESLSSPSVALNTGRLEPTRGLLGKSPKIVEIYKTLARAAMSNSNVLITGESGSGKELVARAIHENSHRRAKKFIAVNCGAIAENILESELFGQFDAAAGGTLFLDEIGDIAPALQIKLLRRIESTEADKIDVRLVAATHRDLEALVRSGKFREDLFYRLKVISMDIPPLRERMADLAELVESFVARFAEKNRKAVSHVSEEAMGLLKSYSWPGNVRELEHAIERAVAMTNATVLFPEDFPAEIARGAAAASGPESVAPAAAPTGARTSLEDMERSHIIKVLQETGFNKSKASEILGIDRATLYRKAQRYGIDLRGK